jgi:hypothetical protein
MIESELERALTAMRAEVVTDEEYKKRLSVVERLHGLMDTTEKVRPVSKETMLNVAANLVGILLIIRHEDVNVIASKALMFVTRMK